MTDQNINPNDNYPEENRQGDFGEIGAFQDSEGTIEPVNSNEDTGPTPEEVAQTSSNVDEDQNQSGEDQQSLSEETSTAESQNRELGEDVENTTGGEQPREQPTEPPAAPSEPWFKEVAGFSGEPTPAVPAKTIEPDLHTDFFTEHWARNEQQPPSTSQTRMVKPAGDWTYEPDRLQDNIPTIPPQESVQSQAGEPTPLPRRVTETDAGATRLTSSAYTPARAASGDTQPVSVPHHPIHAHAGVGGNIPTQPNHTSAAKGKAPKKKKSFPWQAILGAILFLLIIAIVFVGMQYFRIASTLPSVAELRSRTSQFETTRILDRNGNILYEMVDPNAGKRTYVPLERISPYMIAATIATEDKEYYNHPGFDIVAVARALWQNYTSGEIVSGASTITQQLARMLLLEEERFEQSYERKAREIILAAEITRRYSKEEVLELYLNEIYYGNLAYGVEAAAETYFNTTAADLNLWQAAFLAGLPQSPAVYDVYNNREATLTRSRAVLVLMYQLSEEKNCIYIGENLDKVCVSAADALAAREQIETYAFVQKQNTMRFPHWVVYIQSLLEQQFDAQTIYRSGFTIYTTLDPNLQEAAQRAVQDQLATMTANNATNGAVVAINPKNGEILAMVGSADFYNEAISGQVNMAISQTRQPGSAIKPITYLAAFEKDWTPATLIWDVPSEFPPSGIEGDPSAPYVPVNYDGRFHGPVTVRSALANSYNIPAVKALQYVGIYDNPATLQEDGFIAMAKRLGITSLTRPDYGLSLTLGGGEVSLLELTGAYAVIANEGRRVAPVAVTKVVDYTGQTVFEYTPPAGDQVIREAHAFLISSILSDPEARAPMFGYPSVLDLPFAAAAKTGTTNDYRDNWTLGYTPDLVVGVWVGNADYSPMVNTTGVSGAAPIWSRVMQDGISLIYGGQTTPFRQPADIEDEVICAVSGTKPSEWCPSTRVEYFASDQLPAPKEDDLWKEVEIDTWTGLKASAACAELTKRELVINVTDKFAIRWLKETEEGRQWADNYGFPDPPVILPERECQPDDPHAIIELNLVNGQTIRENPFKIIGIIDATANFQDFRIDWGEGEDPTEWNVLVDWNNDPAHTPQEIYEWDLTEVEAPVVTLRVLMRSTVDTQAEKRFTLTLEVPTPTPTETPTPTLTPTATSTEVPTLTPTPLPSPTDTPTESPTSPPPTPTLTPTPLETTVTSETSTPE
jgi:penicillin-binding protein 1C